MRHRGHLAADLADPDKYTAVADADRVIDADVWIEFHVDLGDCPFRVVVIHCFAVKTADGFEVVVH